MNLIVDIGNTQVKAAVFQNASLLYKIAFQREKFLKNLEEIFQSFPHIEYSILSSVVKSSEMEEKFLEEHSKLFTLSPELKQPFVNLYATPATLGKDRMALVAAGAKLYPKKNVLIIDVGSCITYDFKNRNEEYLGGAISPGLAMRFKAMHKFTGNLPLIQSIDKVQLLGNSTEGCMKSGVLNGIVYEIDSFIDSYRAEYKDLTIILTGGDTQILLKRLKNSIFANPNFLLEGLNHILEFNKTQ